MQEEKKANAARIVESRAQHTALLQAGLALLVESKRQELLARGVPEDAINADVAVILMADLQEKQACENNAMNKVLAEKVRQNALLTQCRAEFRPLPYYVTSRRLCGITFYVASTSCDGWSKSI